MIKKKRKKKEETTFIIFAGNLYIYISVSLTYFPSFFLPCHNAESLASPEERQNPAQIEDNKYQLGFETSHRVRNNLIFEVFFLLIPFVSHGRMMAGPFFFRGVNWKLFCICFFLFPLSLISPSYRFVF